ncbi:MAG TPA: protein kinase, partial [Gammaproteobacteria bacterium]|nr:protein kinase [Gammaproteobacteria bacterium]
MTSTSGQSHRIALPAGHTLHWYRIESVLGQGGFGITYLARDTNLNHEVAIKEYLPTDLATRTGDSSVVPISDSQSETYGWGLHRFINEAQTLVKFRHPNIVQVVAVFEANNTAYMVMEYVKGRTLEDAFKYKKVEGEEALLRIFNALLEGLELIHNAGFIHRDVKPDNIYLRDDGTPVLLDFGSARQAIGAQTRTLTALVSPGYAPLEQYDNSTEGERKQGPWTDIYALGATMYRAVVGKAPPDAMQRVNAMVGGKDPYVSATEVGKYRYSETFLRAIDYALAFHPEERPQTIADWRSALQGDLNPEAVTAVFMSPGKQKSAARTTAPAGAGSTAGDTRTATGGGVATARGDLDEMAPPTRRLTELLRGPENHINWMPIVAVVLIVVVASTANWFGNPREEQSAASDETVVSRSRGGETEFSAVEAPPDPEEEARRRAEEARRQAAALEKQLEAQQQLAKAEAKRLAELEAARERKERIAELLEGATADIAEGRLTRPKENNAFYRLTKLIAIDSENREAREGLKRVVEGLVVRSREAMKKQEFSDAASQLAEAEAVLPGAGIVSEARVALEQAKSAYEEEQRRIAEEKVREAEETASAEADRRQAEAIERAESEPGRAEEIESLLADALVDFEAVRLSWPPGKNALERYHRVLELDPDNSKAKTGIAEIGEKYLQLKDQAVAQENFDKAKAYLDKAAQVLPDSEAVKQAQEAYRVAIANHEQSQPLQPPQLQPPESESEQLAKARAELERLKLEQKKLESEIQEKSTPAVLASAGEKLRIAIVPFWGRSQYSPYVNKHDGWLEEVARNIVSQEDVLEIVFSSYAGKAPNDVATDL